MVNVLAAWAYCTADSEPRRGGVRCVHTTWALEVQDLVGSGQHHVNGLKAANGLQSALLERRGQLLVVKGGRAVDGLGLAAGRALAANLCRLELQRLELLGVHCRLKQDEVVLELKYIEFDGTLSTTLCALPGCCGAEGNNSVRFD